MMQIEEEESKKSTDSNKFLSSSRIALGSGVKGNEDKLLQKKFIMNNDDHLVFKLFFGKILRYMTYSEENQQVTILLILKIQ